VELQKLSTSRGNRMAEVRVLFCMSFSHRSTQEDRWGNSPVYRLPLTRGCRVSSTGRCLPFLSFFMLAFPFNALLLRQWEAICCVINRFSREWRTFGHMIKPALRLDEHRWHSQYSSYLQRNTLAVDYRNAKTTSASWQLRRLGSCCLCTHKGTSFPVSSFSPDTPLLPQPAKEVKFLPLSICLSAR